MVGDWGGLFRRDEVMPVLGRSGDWVLAGGAVRVYDFSLDDRSGWWLTSASGMTVETGVVRFISAATEKVMVVLVLLACQH